MSSFHVLYKSRKKCTQYRESHCAVSRMYRHIPTDGNILFLYITWFCGFCVLVIKHEL